MIFDFICARDPIAVNLRAISAIRVHLKPGDDWPDGIIMLHGGNRFEVSAKAEEWARLQTAWRRWNERLDYTCAVCDANPIHGDYQATTATWAEAGFKPKDVACWGCFLTRLGRPPTLSDFVDAPVNAVVCWALCGPQESRR